MVLKGLKLVFFSKISRHRILYKAFPSVYILQFISSSCKYFEENSNSKV